MDEAAVEAALDKADAAIKRAKEGGLSEGEIVVLPDDAVVIVVSGGQMTGFGKA